MEAEVIGTGRGRAGSAPRREGLRALACAAGFLGIAAGLQCHTGSPLDGDTAYHVAVGRLIAQHGILHAFPWTPFSWLAEHYADKELAFHLALAAVAGLPWATAARIVGAIWGAGLLLATYGLLRAERVRFPSLWAVLPLASSAVFLFRFVLVRPHVASVAFAAAILGGSVRRRPLVVAVLAMAYPWFYVGWPIAVVMPCIAEGARILSRERPDWRPLAAAVVGAGAGVLLHPNAANLVGFARVELVDVLLRGAWGREAILELGDEFRPFTIGEWGKWLAGPLAACAAAGVLAWRSGDVATRAFALAAACFCALTLRTARFAEYFVPFSILALALASRSVRWRWFPAVAAGCLALYAAPTSAKFLRDAGRARDLMPPVVASRLAAAIPAGSQVFTCEWGLTGTMMLALPDRRFIVALDPTLFYVQSPDLYRAWFSLPRNPPEHPAAAIRDLFHARYVLCRWDPRFRRFFNALALDGPTRPLLPFGTEWEAYDLGP